MTITEKYLAEGREEGREKGREEGMEAKAVETALKMFKDGFTLEQIAKYVNLSVEKIETAIAAVNSI